MQLHTAEHNNNDFKIKTKKLVSAFTVYSGYVPIITGAMHRS